ncbi:hypothetical protein [uncultured Moraxella sp.]
MFKAKLNNFHCLSVYVYRLLGFGIGFL